MKSGAIALTCLLGIFLSTFSLCDETTEQPDVQFADAFDCAFPKDCGKGLFLGGSHKAGLRVTLIRDKGVDRRKTSYACELHRDLANPDFVWRSGGPFPFTRLVGNERSNDNRTGDAFDIVRLAVISSKPINVRLIDSRKHFSGLSDDMRAKAREFVRPTPEETFFFWGPQGISDSPLTTWTAEGVTICRLEYSRQFLGDIYGGPMALIFKKRLFDMWGKCGANPLFFTINNKLHLVYEAFECCTCSLVRCKTCVYDVSGEAPRRLYLGEFRSPQ